MRDLNVDEEAKFGHAFNLIEGVNALRLKNIFKAFNYSFKKAWEAEFSEVLKITRSEDSAKRIFQDREKINPEKEWKKITDAGISAATVSDGKYPSLLKEIFLPPAIIYFKGDISFLNSGVNAAVVGTRRATYYGLQASFNLSRDLASAGVGVISGLALGIDARAHEGALSAGGKTFAVLGSGISCVQPKTNLRLAEKIISSGGALISEYPPELQADTWTFPQRNRIIAGLSKLTIIIEAPEKSGALITANFAVDANRDIGVVPGEIFSPVAKGSNKLLKQGVYPILEVNDALEVLGILESKELTDKKIFDDEELKILNGIGEFISYDELFNKIGIGIKIFNQKLTMLEIKGVIRSINGGFERV